jgi:hypothetical protein
MEVRAKNISSENDGTTKNRMFPPGEGKVALARQVMDVRDEWIGDLYLTQKFCLFLTGEAPSKRQLERQVHGVRTLLVAYGPNQAVLVNPQGDPQAHGFQYQSIPTTLEACLTLPYITEHIVVHGVKNPHRQDFIPSQNSKGRTGHRKLITRTTDFSKDSNNLANN